MKAHLIIEQYEDYKRLIESHKKRIVMFAEANYIANLQKEVKDLKEKEKQLDNFLFLDTEDLTYRNDKIM